MALGVLEAKRQIFDMVCSESRRSRKPDFALRAQDVRVQLKISPDVFGKALDAFIHGHSQMYIEVFIGNNERYLRLGPTGKSLCQDNRQPF